MMKIFYGNKKEKNNESHKIKRNIEKIISKNVSRIKKENILDIEESNDEKLININNKKHDGYIYYGNNQLFKTKNSKIFSCDAKNNKMKTQTIFVKINNNKIFRRNLSDNKIENDENIYHNYQKNKKANNILNNSINTREKIFRRIKNIHNHNDSSKFPYIKNNTKEQESNNFQNNIQNNNLNIEFHQLNQLHKNIINMLKNRTSINKEKDTFDNNIKYKYRKIRKYNSQKIIKENKKIPDEIINQTKKDINTFKSIKNNFPIFYNKNNLINNKNNNNIISKNHSLKIENNEKKENEKKQELNKTQSQSNKTIKNNMNAFKNYIFSNPNQTKNFSFNSTKNMKISQNESEKINKENLKSKINYKTSTYFFSPKFKKNLKNALNINEIINIAIENNIKAGQASMTSVFENIGRNYLNKKIKKNFFSTSYEKRWEKEQTKEKINQEFNKYSNNNFLNLFLFETENWEKHENIWINLKQNLTENNLVYILPPNDEDILISSYIKLYQKKNTKNIISININEEKIKNPREEIKKWKIAYKNSLLRWHPDKLFPLLKEIKIKIKINNENIINEIKRRSNIIINNINNTYQKIMEILNKILFLNEK